MKQSIKRKRLLNSNKKGVASERKGDDASIEQRIPNSVLEAFSSVSLNEGILIDGNSNCSLNKDTEAQSTFSSGEDQSTTCSASSGNYDFSSSSSSNMAEVQVDANIQDEILTKNKPKMKKIVASSGTVSSFLHKDYMRSIPKKGSMKMKTKHEETLSKEEAGQFLYSVLGDDTELSFAVVRDVFCQCDYNLDKALDVLLELSSSSTSCSDAYKESAGGKLAYNSKLNLNDRTSSSGYYLSDVDSQGDVCVIGNTFSNFSTLAESRDGQTSTVSGISDSEFPHEVLESLFRIPTPKTSKRDPNTMNWKNVVKKITSLSQGFEPIEFDSEKLKNVKGGEYQIYRESANQHWDSMKSYYKKATTAFNNGDKAYAAYLSEQGRLQKQLAKEADEKGSQDIFVSRNKNIKNTITIDLHGQHIKQGMKLLKLHLLFGACVRSVRSFRVITGYSSGKSNLKNSVTSLLDKEGISWCEENQGSLMIRLGQHTSFSFLDTGSDSD